MDLTPMHKRVIALDVHQAKITACAVVEHDDGRVEVTKRDFGAFKRDRRALAQWALEMAPEVVVMESTGVYWKSPFAALEAVGLIAWVVNARHVKAVPGRKTDMADAQWLATLARAGLLRASFIPPVQMRQLRLVARQRQKLVGMCSAEKNRLHKVLVDAGIRINVLVADILGQSARVKVKALIVGRSMQEVLDRKGRLQASWPVGWHLPRQQQEHRQAQSRAHLQGQRLVQKAAVRVRPGCSTNALRTQGQVRRADHPKRPQEVGGGSGPQDAAHHPCHAHQRQSLPGQAGGLRGVQCSAQRAAPLTGAGWRCTRCFQFGRMAIPRGVLCLSHNQAIRSPATPCARSRQPSLRGL